MSAPFLTEKIEQRLLDAINDPSGNGFTRLNRHEVSLVQIVRMRYAMLLMTIAVKLEAGVKPQSFNPQGE